MEELENRVSEQENVGDNTANYIEAIKEMKANSVSKEAYDKLQQENKQLLNSLVNGQSIEVEKEPEVDIEALRKELYSTDNNMSSLEYVNKTLQLRKALMEKGELDPFVMKAGKLSSPEVDDFKKAERVASVLQECVDIADGNPVVFDNEFQRRLI